MRMVCGAPIMLLLSGTGRMEQTHMDHWEDHHPLQTFTYLISNSDHITLNPNTPTRVSNTTVQQTSSPGCLTHCTTGHHGQLNTHYHHTTYPSSPQLTYDMTTDYNKTANYKTNYKKSDWTQFMEDTEPAFAQTNIHTANITNILMADKHSIPKGKMHSNCRLLPDHIVCKITQRNNIRRANTCDLALKLLNEELISDIQKHKQNR